MSVFVVLVTEEQPIMASVVQKDFVTLHRDLVQEKALLALHTYPFLLLALQSS